MENTKKLYLKTFKIQNKIKTIFFRQIFCHPYFAFDRGSESVPPGCWGRIGGKVSVLEVAEVRIRLRHYDRSGTSGRTETSPQKPESQVRDNGGRRSKVRERFTSQCPQVGGLGEVGDNAPPIVNGFVK